MGALVARRLGRELVDTDQLIEAREGRTIPEIFAAEGEAYFRDRERDVSLELAGRDGLVIACGGGLPLREENRAAVRQGGVVFWLKRDPASTFASIRNSPLWL